MDMWFEVVVVIELGIIALAYLLGFYAPRGTRRANTRV